MKTKRVTAPICMVERMSQMPNGGWWLRAGGYVFHVTPNENSWSWNICLDVPMIANGVTTGAQAAANAATRWVVKRAELALKLAGRRAA